LAEDVAVFWSEDGQGRIIEQGPIAQVFSQPKHELTAGYLRGEWG
jgi:ABC-type phosphate transport system ATPase subunit